jgi:transcription elongation GreA/GreB family factor
MSRAFVKEDESDKTELPERPISPHRNFVTEAGLAAIEAALSRFEAAHRAATGKGDGEAATGALREIRYWRTRRASAEVVKPPADKSKAFFGMTVTLRRVDGREQSFRIVGEDEGRSLARHALVRVAARAGRYAFRMESFVCRRQRTHDSEPKSYCRTNPARQRRSELKAAPESASVRCAEAGTNSVCP